MNQTDLKFIYILGYAGHGKDTAKNILKEHYSNNTFCNLSFADTMKTQVSDILPQNVLGAVDGDTAFEKLNKLKDNHPEIEVFSGMNARKLLQVLGTEFYRSESLDPNIHVRFSAKRVLENLNSNVDENVVYASSDTRFPNELNFLLQASQCQTDKELDGFLKYYLNTCKEIDTKDNVLNHFKQVFNLSSLDDLACDLFDRIWVDVAGIKTTFDVENNYDFNIPDTQGMKKEEAAKYGLLHVFRPIVSPETKLSDSLNSTDLMARIKTYTQMTMSEVKSVRDNFKHYGVDFDSKNVQKYGFLRADVTHYSESALNDRKPEAFLSEPMTNPVVKENFEKSLIELFDASKRVDSKLENNLKSQNQYNHKRKI